MAAFSAGVLLLVWLVELWQIARPTAVVGVLGTLGLALFVAFALVRAAAHIRRLFCIVIAVSAGIALWLGDARVLYHGFEKAQIFGAFLPSVLLLRATVERSAGLRHLQAGVAGLPAHGLVNWTFYGSHALGAILNVGALAVLAPVVTRSASERERHVLAGSAARGVGTAIMWSPFFVAMAFTSQLVPQAALWKLMAVGGVLAVIGFALSHLLFTPSLSAGEFVRSLLGLRPLLLPTGAMVAAVLITTSLFKLTGLQAVAVCIPVLCLLYLVLAARDRLGGTLRQAFANFGSLSNELLIVVGATVLGVAVSALPVAGELAGSMSPGLASGPLLIAALVVGLVALGQLGLHPMIGASVLAPTLAAAPFGLAPEIVASTLVFAWALSATVAIWTLPVAAAASSFDVPVQHVSTRRAYVGMVLHGALAIAALSLINAWMRG